MGILVSAVIATRNETANLPDCLAALAGFADEIIVVDESDDETPELAERLGARVIRNRRAPGMSIESNFALGFREARGQWIFRLDADERLCPTLAAELLQLARGGTCEGVRFARRNIMFGGWARHGGWFRAELLFFFASNAWDRDWDCATHSQVPVRGRIVTLPATPALSTLHLDYHDVAQFIRRSFAGYVPQEAEHLWRQGVRPSPYRLIWRPVRRFFGRYVIRQGFRDGWRGLVLAALLAVYDLCLEAMLWDITRRKGPPPR
jgi:glycosyltransferase involved in cell wall biosynthesis